MKSNSDLNKELKQIIRELNQLSVSHDEWKKNFYEAQRAKTLFALRINEVKNYKSKPMAENLTITTAAVLDAHKTGNADQKKILEKLHPQLFKYEGYKKIDSLEAALKFLGLTKADAKITLSKKLQSHLAREQASLHLDLIADAIRGGHDREVDYRNGDQKKWYPWFTYKVPSGFGFSGTDYGNSDTYTNVGSRRQFLTSEEAEWFGTKFIELHRIELEGTPRKK